MDFVSPVLDIASCLWDCTAKRAVYSRELPENLNSLRIAMEDLKNVYGDVKEKVDREEKLRKKRTRAVDGWIQSVEAMEKEMNDLLAKGDEEIQKKCLGTCCPKNCRARYKIGKMVRGKMDEVTLKKTEGLNFSVVAEPPPSPTVIERPVDKMVGLDSLFDHVCMQLQDDKVGSVGLYGMGGVGKTTLLTRINNESLKTRVEFDAVIWVTVSRPATVEKVQQVLFNKLAIRSFQWESRSEDERKEAIFNVLKTKKFLLLLDDIWEPLDLFAVGIPPVNDGSKSKVVFTTRFSTVCRDMGAKKSIEVKCLAWEEAFALFQKYVGEDTINSHPHIPKLAQIVAKECDGLPLALKTIGRAMAGAKTPEEWEKKIPMLKNYPAKFPGMENHLFSRLAFSYDSLQDEAVKSCFLYCSLFPEDHHIDCNELVRLWIGEGFLDEYGDIKEAKNEGEEIISSLKHACLLETVNSKYRWWFPATYVKMHDVIRDMALWLACQNGNKKQNKFVFIDKGELVKAYEVEKWKETQRISLRSGSFDELMEPPSFPNLQTLLVSNEWSKSFPRGFFTCMPILTVLDLSFYPQMTDLPMEICKLFTLRYLNLSHTGIEKIPMELRNLTKLRCLILDGIPKLEIPSQTILGLSSLKLFSMVYYSDTERDDRVLLEELEGLKCIEQISISLGSVPSILKLLNSHELQRCVRRLALKQCEGMNLLHLLLPYLEEFAARDCSNLEDVTINLEKEVVHSTFPRHQYLYHLSEVQITLCKNLMKLTFLIYAPNLKFLWIGACGSLEEVIEVDQCGVSKIESDGLFSRLVRLHLLDLPKLRSICRWSLLFPSLKVMRVFQCPNLRKLSFDSNIGISKNVEEIRGKQEWWDDLEWEDQTIKHNLTPYFKPDDW